MTKIFMLTLALLSVSSAPAMAQESPAGFDSRWNPYLGCWTVAQEQMGQQPISVPAGTMVCVRPSGRFGVAITTTVDGKNVLEQTIVADGSAQPLSQGDCTGTQTSEWSRDGERLFTRVTLNCTGRPARTVSGITMMTKGQWVDVQATVIDNDHDLRVRRYRRSSEQYTGMPVQTMAPLSVEDVVEASAKVQSPAVEAVLLEAGGRFTLNSRVLRQLADAKVSPNVIDLMVAQAYPERFDIDTGVYPPAPVSSASTYSGGSSSVVMGSTTYPYPMYDPFYSGYYYYSPFAYPYYWGSGYRYRYGYPLYRNYGYDFYGYPLYYGGGGYINPGSGSGGGNAQPGSPDSRGGDGIATSRGYTRVRPAGSTSGDSGQSATPSNRGGSVGRGVRGIDSGSSNSSGSSSSSGSSGSSGASSGGYSGGGGADSGGGGRTAQPR